MVREVQAVVRLMPITLKSSPRLRLRRPTITIFASNNYHYDFR